MRFVAEDLAAKVAHTLAKAEYHERVTLAARYREPMIATRRPSRHGDGVGQANLAKPAPKPGKTDLS